MCHGALLHHQISRECVPVDYITSFARSLQWTQLAALVGIIMYYDSCMFASQSYLVEAGKLDLFNNS